MPVYVLLCSTALPLLGTPAIISGPGFLSNTALLLWFTNSTPDSTLIRTLISPRHCFGIITLIAFGFLCNLRHRSLWDSLRPQACMLSVAKICIAFACIRWLSIHSRYIPYIAPLHISFHWPISPVQHRTSYQNLLCCHVQVPPGIRHNPYTHLSLFASLSTRDF